MDTPLDTETPAVPAGLSESGIVGLKYFDQLLPLLKRLRDDGCDRDRAGNRELHFDQYAALVLLYLFNPICSSLRAVQQASELLCVQSRERAVAIGVWSRGVGVGLVLEVAAVVQTFGVGLIGGGGDELLELADGDFGGSQVVRQDSLQLESRLFESSRDD